MTNKKLEKLYKRVDACRFCKAMGNKLQHIHGFGAMTAWISAEKFKHLKI